MNINSYECSWCRIKKEIFWLILVCLFVFYFFLLIIIIWISRRRLFILLLFNGKSKYVYCFLFIQYNVMDSNLNNNDILNDLDMVHVIVDYHLNLGNLYLYVSTCQQIDKKEHIQHFYLFFIQFLFVNL